MRLKSIKLTGFKSFVDSTLISFPSNLCGIVGPNGCGKSNIIDAVRWVLGESSAKQLRGDSLSDVIFNGSNERKPVGQASVELIFDNSDGRITGEYAAFKEISVKRRLVRDGTNDYLLNNSKCRRRDITDIFLGTGLGPRSYSIIEQDMIMRMITARPEELRAYMEEAAGISKYRERRRETESRIARTRENLTRLADIRDELGRQLKKLHKHAREAEKYRGYRSEQRQLKDQLLVLHWTLLQRQLEEKLQEAQKLTLELNRRQALETKNQTQLQKCQVEIEAKNQNLNDTQGQYYAVNSEVSRLEQTIHYNKKRSQELQEELQRTIKNSKYIHTDLEQDGVKITGWEAELAELNREWTQSKQLEEGVQKEQQQAVQQLQQWQLSWDEFSQQLARLQQLAEVDREKITHLQTQGDHLSAKALKLDQQLSDLDHKDTQLLAEKIAAVQQQKMQGLASVEKLQNNIQRQANDMDTVRKQLSADQSELSQTRVSIQEARGKLASLQELQNSLQRIDEAADKWLRQQQLKGKAILYSQLQVEPGWERALEMVLRDSLQGICVDDLGGPALNSLNTTLLLVGRAPTKAPPTRQQLTRLSDKIKGDYIPAHLNSVYIATDIEAALSLQPKLEFWESIVTADGKWLGYNWLRSCGDEASEFGVIERQKVIAKLEQTLENQLQREAEIQKACEDNSKALNLLESQQQQIMSELGHLAQIQKTFSEQESQLQQQHYKQEQLLAEQKEVQLLIQQAQKNMTTQQQTVATVAADINTLTAEKKNRLKIKQQLEASVLAADQQAQEVAEKSNKLSLRERTVQTQLMAMKESRQRLQGLQQRAQERVAELEQQYAEIPPIDDLQTQLEGKLQLKVSLEAELTKVRQKLNEIRQRIQDIEYERAQLQETVREQQQLIQQEELKTQEVRTKKYSLEEQLPIEEIEAIADDLPEEANIDKWQLLLEAKDKLIQKLGAINLAAIDEYQIELDRKQYLDAQNDELVDALDTLEKAIANIDKETKTRFKSTFDKINEGIKGLFPKLFGGGYAYLELTENDLLNAGVTFIARPPGKRNSSIYQLSGGEKALTALVLVFSIFQLNPAPFCMLDEVDAPLDESNVERFASMLNEMSSTVQFIVVTHNQITIEKVHQLMGITMQEAGVARVVSVDVDKVIELAS